MASNVRRRLAPTLVVVECDVNAAPISSTLHGSNNSTCVSNSSVLLAVNTSRFKLSRAFWDAGRCAFVVLFAIGVVVGSVIFAVTAAIMGFSNAEIDGSKKLFATDSSDARIADMAASIAIVGSLSPPPPSAGSSSWCCCRRCDCAAVPSGRGINLSPHVRQMPSWKCCASAGEMVSSHVGQNIIITTAAMVTSSADGR